MHTRDADDPLPLTSTQLSGLLSAVVRELVWGRRAVSREMRRWHERATRIPDAPIREDVLTALTRKRGNTDGAALFWILPRHRDPGLLRLLIAHELIWDILDSICERGAQAGEANGDQLHRATLEALDPAQPLSDYFLHHPWRDDGGFLRALVDSCRVSCLSLPSYSRIQALAVREAMRANVQGLNHIPDPGRRDSVLKAWAEREYPGHRELAWFELTGASSAPVVLHTLLSLAAETTCTDDDVAQAYAAYFPWVSLTATMLDSYVDQVEDAANGDHSYWSHYPTGAVAVLRLHDAIGQSARRVRDLRNGQRHAVIVACMVAMYLSKDSARTPEFRSTTQELARAGGSLTWLLLPILRAWRIRYGQRAA
jgi:tetraprenyl-beta-curcumene synthase